MERDFLVPNYWPDGVRLQEGLVIESGKGATLFDTRGNSYIDMNSGIAVSSLGHNHEGVVAAISAQASKLIHASNLFHTEPALKLAELLVSNSSLGKAFFCNSGCEANEAAFKFARRYHRNKQGWSMPEFQCSQGCATTAGTCDCWSQQPAGRARFVSFQGGFHGRSMGALGLTHKPAIRAPFGPFAADVTYAEYNDVDGLRATIDENVAAVFVEPVQGEGGVKPATREFMQAVREVCTEAGALMVVDEVQTGLGRTGRFLAHEAYGVEPDMVTLAKPLANGIPIGACLVTDEVAAQVKPGDHGTTFGGNPLACAAGVEVISQLLQPGFLEGVREKGALLRERVEGLKERCPSLISAVRGPVDPSLFLGVDFTVPVGQLQAAAAEQGVLFITAGPNTLRLAPPLVISEAEIGRAMDVLEKVLLETAGNDAA